MIETLSKAVSNKKGIPVCTNYYDAVHWLHNSYVMCNNIVNTDDSIWDNMRFGLDYDNEGNEESNDIYQWFITSACESDVEYLEKRFDLKFTYSDKLECFILCVMHYGTAWDYVYCSDSEMDTKAKKELAKLDKAKCH